MASLKHWNICQKEYWTINKVLALGLFIRVAVSLISSYLDKHFRVNYTDIDYEVFTDASRYVLKGMSPYMRATYRYTPLLAYILTGNILIHDAFGKVLFSFLDILMGWIAYVILTKHLNVMKKTQAIGSVAAFIVFNPIVFNVSTRGNADQLVVVIVMLTLYFYFEGHYWLCGLFYGLSIHLKIYPLIYAPLFVLSIIRKLAVNLPRPPIDTQVDMDGATRSFLRNDYNEGLKRISKIVVKIILITLTVIISLGLLFFYLYGWECLYETYFYHFVRTDHRHNFSIYFYMIYVSSVAKSSLTSLLMFLPQVIVLLVISLKYYVNDRSLIFGMYLQTMTFVAFNKVMTVQYFVWFLPLFAMVIPFLDMKWGAHLLIYAIWLGIGQGVWLNQAYKLEFLGESNFFSLFAASSVFFIINISMMVIYIFNFDGSSPQNDQKQVE